MAFDAERQAIIDGLVSAQAEGTGWNAIRAGIPVTAVVRTSSTVVTITLPALATYNITAEETITCTVPASALNGAAPIVATPTLTVEVVVAPTTRFLTLLGVGSGGGALPGPLPGYYVATTGSDAGAGTFADPWLTFNYAIDQLAPGDTLWMRAGVYVEGFLGGMPSGTSWADPIRIANYNGESVTLRPGSGFGRVMTFSVSTSYVEFDGINLDAVNTSAGGGVMIETNASAHSHHLRFQNLDIKGAIKGTSRSQCVLITDDNNTSSGANEFINCTVHGSGYDDFSHGFYLAARNNLVDGCEIYDFPGAGIQVYNGSGGTRTNGNVLRNNLIRDGRSTTTGQRHWGMVIYGADQGIQAYNNVIYNIPSNGSGTHGVEIGAYRVSLWHNTFTQVAGTGINVTAGTLNVIQNNISYANTVNYNAVAGSVATQNFNMFGVDPLFVDASGGDFRVLAGSLAIDTGITLAAVTTDFNGVARPTGVSSDKGAFEQ
jgi:hypothetical protein